MPGEGEVHHEVDTVAVPLAGGSSWRRQLQGTGGPVASASVVYLGGREAWRHPGWTVVVGQVGTGCGEGVGGTGPGWARASRQRREGWAAGKFWESAVPPRAACF